jgi:hypothetical protein
MEFQKHKFTITANGLYWPGIRNACHDTTPPERCQVELVKAYIVKNFRPADRPHKQGSYTIKHVIERSIDVYVSNGATQQAFFELGYRLKPLAVGNLNCRIYYAIKDD